MGRPSRSMGGAQRLWAGTGASDSPSLGPVTFSDWEQRDTLRLGAVTLSQGAVPLSVRALALSHWGQLPSASGSSDSLSLGQ